MKKIVLIFSFFFTVVIGFAQTQTGFVKTLGRPEQAGQPLEGVSIRVQGHHNPVVSDNDGIFSILMTDKKNGDVYVLQQVQKNGYELNESDIIGRKLAFSDKVSLNIVMVSSEQLQADKQRIEEKAYATAQQNYNHIFDSLERQLKTNVVTLEQYDAQINDHQTKFNN